MPDLVYPSSNEWGIPDLMLQPCEGPPPLVAPFVVWGSIARRRSVSGTFCFYTDDYRFTSLWERPDLVVNTQCAAVVEPNFSVFAETPRAVAAWAVYRKRWLARYWQTKGITVWVDLHGPIDDLALAGVPKGWQRWATVGTTPDELTEAACTALAWSAGAPSTLLVYSGDASVREWCAGREGVIHVAHRSASRHRPGEGTRRKESQ